MKSISIRSLINSIIYDTAHKMAERGLFVRDDFGEPNIRAITELARAVTSGLELPIERLIKTENRLHNLLAVIHRDGGHYRVKYGEEKAAMDAEQIIIGERTKNDPL